MAVISFLPRLAALHEDNQAARYVLAGVTSHSPKMMEELRRLCPCWTTTTFTLVPCASDPQRALGQKAQPPLVQRRLATIPYNVSRDGHPVRTAHDRPLRVRAQHATPSLQHEMARPALRGGGRASPIRRPLARRKQMVQSLVAPTTRPRSETPPERRYSYSGCPPMARKSVAPSSYRVGVPRDDPPGARSLVPSREAARTRYSRYSLTNPSLSSGLSSGMVVPPPEINEFHLDHVQHVPH
jgi:hypothetical protein